LREVVDLLRVALSHEPIDGRADLYGLGCVAYWLLTGCLVFEEKSSTATILAHVQSAPVSPSERSGIPVPASLERLTLACLAGLVILQCIALYNGFSLIAG